MKDNKLKGKDFFNVKESPMITFKSTRNVQTGPNTFDVEGNFTIRGVTKTEKLTLMSEGKGTPYGSLDGTMAFDRKEYGINSDIPFIKIANRLEVNVRLKCRRVSGPPPSFPTMIREFGLHPRVENSPQGIRSSPGSQIPWCAGEFLRSKVAQTFAGSARLC